MLENTDNKNKPEKKENKPKTIDSLWTFLIAVACLGPFALPLLWRNPRYKTSTKVYASIAVVAFTYFLMEFAVNMLGTMMESFSGIAL